ncbi:transcriptional regulator [Flavobacterium akiainvivens]|uniref:Transcriptional regulator n=1 Tax=Flavobacterium akiainvivens TaxID=1202724 RepID=A0A0M8M783_9FLAO|nr:response regulator transcription factor [Flavobacterium akiainvivens]KOS04813.1 transcriptional regulator [Flavobacterium akiainvivens]SFQ43793.1 DNA-binding response regulator, NarL/FixJ family, contains REC and HTH domains [Flavobacterium akiainvivens]
MFKKILVAEDVDSTGLYVKMELEKLCIEEPVYVKYCDEAFLKLKKSYLDNTPFELIITDLSFTGGNREAKLAGGEELIKAIKEQGWPIKIIAYSIEDRGHKIRHLLNDCNIDAYVLKSRDSISQLQNAINIIYKDGTYLSPELSYLRKPDMLLELDATDLEIIKLLSDGLSQNEITDLFKKERKKASSFSSVEKRIIKMRTSLQAKNTTHLVSIAKDMGLI